jgi:HK97 family phage portal protein
VSLWSWLGRKILLTDGTFWSLFYGGETYAGKTVTPESAMNLSAWWACVSLISETIATLPLGIYQKMPDGSRIPRPDHPLSKLLTETPNGSQTDVEFWCAQIAPVCIIGNSYARKEMRGEEVVALLPMAFEMVRPYRDATSNRLRYKWLENGKERDLGENEVFHIRGFGAGGDLGLSPVAAARETLGGAMATEEAAARMFGKGMRASGFIQAPGVLKPEQRAQLQKNLIDKVEGSGNEGRVVTLEANFKWVPANIPPKDAEMIASRSFNVTDICRWMRVPPILVGHAAEGQTMWGSGIEQIMIGWLRLGLKSYLKRIESAIWRRLLTPADQADGIYAEFNIEGLLRGDMAAQAQFISTMVQNGLLTRNEGRALYNRQAIAGADELTAQVNLVPLNLLGRQQQAPEPAAQMLDRFGHPRGEQDVKAPATVH